MQRLKKYHIAVIVLAIIMVIIVSQKLLAEKVKVSDTRFCLDTTCSVEIHDIEKEKGEKLMKESFEICQRYEKMLSRTIPGSDIYKINHAKGRTVEVSQETVDIINTALKISKQSGGMFDITIGRLTALWNFSAEKPRKPEDSEIKRLLSTVGYRKVEVNGRTVRLRDRETWLDLGAIAKGYIADRMSKMLIEKGVGSGIVNLGGNIVCIGGKSDGSDWKIGIETPYSKGKKLADVIAMKNQSLVTSGTYERYIEYNGKKYHHVLDPRTGYPVETDLECVSILGREGSSVNCDAFSTVCLLLGEAGAEKFMKSHSEYAALTVKNGKASKNFGNWPAGAK